MANNSESVNGTFGSDDAVSVKEEESKQQTHKTLPQPIEEEFEEADEANECDDDDSDYEEEEALEHQD